MSLLSLYFSVTHFCAPFSFSHCLSFITHAHVYLHIIAIFINRTISNDFFFNVESPTVPALCHIYLSIYLPIVFVYTFSNSSLFCFTLQRYSSQRAEGTSSPVCATFLVLFLFFFYFISVSRRILCISITSFLFSFTFSYILLHLYDSIAVSLSYNFLVESSRSEKESQNVFKIFAGVRRNDFHKLHCRFLC